MIRCALLVWSRARRFVPGTAPRTGGRTTHQTDLLGYGGLLYPAGIGTPPRGYRPCPHCASTSTPHPLSTIAVAVFARCSGSAAGTACFWTAGVPEPSSASPGRAGHRRRYAVQVAAPGSAQRDDLAVLALVLRALDGGGAVRVRPDSRKLRRQCQCPHRRWWPAAATCFWCGVIDSSDVPVPSAG